MAKPEEDERRGVFHLILIKPTHYDDDGYPIQWMRSPIPSNTLACLNALAEDVRDRRVLGAGVEIRIAAIDETNQRVRRNRLIARIRASGGKALVALVGVQTNQFPRAVDIARPFAAAGIPVCIGGFHVSGCVAMLPELPVEIREAQRLGISMFAGEAEEGRLDEVVLDAFGGRLKPFYNHMDDLPALEGEPPSFLPARHVARTVGSTTSVDLGRGCPYQCSFCTIINVQGRKSRYRTADDFEAILRKNHAQGVKRFFITDDNFARNKKWEELFDRAIALRAEGLDLGFTIQVDTLCHKIPDFIKKAGAAGVRRVFIGLENINPDNLLAANKRQNKITEYRALLQKWRSVGAITYAGYIIGFPADTVESVRRDVEIIKRELPLDILEFFILTPLPGSEDHRNMAAKGVWMDPDMNKYDVNHRVSHHASMSDAEWEKAYRIAWETYYTPEHMRTVMRRALANPRGRPSALLTMLLWFSVSLRDEGVHPLEAGLFRIKHRTDRRPGLSRENPLAFYPRYWTESVTKLWSLGSSFLRLKAMMDEGKKAADRYAYSDVAIAPQAAEEFEALDLYRATAGGEEALARRRRDDAIRSGQRKTSAAAS